MLLAGSMVLLNLLSAPNEFLDLRVQVCHDHGVLLSLLVIKKDHLSLGRCLLDHVLLLRRRGNVLLLGEGFCGRLGILALRFVRAPLLSWLPRVLGHVLRLIILPRAVTFDPFLQEGIAFILLWL